MRELALEGGEGKAHEEWHETKNPYSEEGKTEPFQQKLSFRVLRINPDAQKRSHSSFVILLHNEKECPFGARMGKI